MKILINKTDKNILPITKIYDLGSVTTTIDDLLNESTITLEKNITPILSIDGSNYLINNFSSTNIKEDFEAIITESDLISLGGSGSSEPVDPRPYKVYTALLTQSGTDAPVATVLENTLGGDITFSYEEDGWYNVISNSLFVENKTTCSISITSQETYGYHLIKRISEGIIKINSVGVSGGVYVLTDSILDNSTIEIRVYN